MAVGYKGDSLTYITALPLMDTPHKKSTSTIMEVLRLRREKQFRL